MGTSTESDICKNVVQVGRLTSIHDKIEEICEELDDVDWDFKNLTINTDIGNGWKIVDQAVDAGKKGRLYADKLVKDKYEVFMVNSHEYSIVGEYWYEVFSSDKKAVEKFVDDFKTEVYSVEIEDVESVNQTG